MGMKEERATGGCSSKINGGRGGGLRHAGLFNNWGPITQFTLLGGALSRNRFGAHVWTDISWIHRDRTARHWGATCRKFHTHRGMERSACSRHSRRASVPAGLFFFFSFTVSPMIKTRLRAWAILRNMSLCSSIWAKKLINYTQKTKNKGSKQDQWDDGRNGAAAVGHGSNTSTVWQCLSWNLIVYFTTTVKLELLLHYCYCTITY